MGFLLNLSYRQDNIGGTLYDHLLEGLGCMGGSQIIILITALIIIVFLIAVVVNRKKYLPESETIKYIYGYPAFDNTKEGIIEINDDKVIFKESFGNKIYFLIPLKQITNVTAHRNPMSAIAYWRLGPAAIAMEVNCLMIKFQQDNKEYSVEFLANRNSTIIQKLEKDILEAKTKL